MQGIGVAPLSGGDILACLLADHTRLRHQLGNLQDREGLEHLSWLSAHLRAEGEVLLARALREEPLRAACLEAMEENELVELLIERLRRSVDADQRAARTRVLVALVEHQLEKRESVLYERASAFLSPQEREELGLRYRESMACNELAPVLQLLPAEVGRAG